jgi:hypothetical protein
MDMARPGSRRVFLLLAGVSGASWLVVVVILGAGYLLRGPVPAGECPHCAALPDVAERLAAAAAWIWIVTFGLSVGLLTRSSLPGLPYASLWIIVVGVVLLPLLGIGLPIVIGGLLLLGVGLRPTPLPAWPPVAMVLAWVAAFLIGQPIDAPQEPNDLTVAAAFSLASIVGLAWFWLAWRAREFPTAVTSRGAGGQVDEGESPK